MNRKGACFTRSFFCFAGGIEGGFARGNDGKRRGVKLTENGKCFSLADNNFPKCLQESLTRFVEICEAFNGETQEITGNEKISNTKRNGEKIVFRKVKICGKFCENT